ncbi:endospore germination permease [Paenibacillus sp. 5J-6]|uniref:Endospore germination permease n=1 Tax=Paenibacillus silvestris TaxID=2606219 RepID=A0A6L8V1N8_9BACL|nr:endospore germination permease [Paenibacillus silvestris]MZQ83179.1 endospore germination permease [Paenibacillus silvestris]
MRLSITQFFWLIATIQVSMTIWLTISPTIGRVHQDAWISIIIGGGMGLWTTFVSAKISALNPGLTLIEVNRVIFGKWLGAIISLLYMLAWLSVTVVILRAMAQFVQLVLFFQTPIQVICVIMILIMIYITHGGGITAIGRFSLIVGPLFYLIILLSFVLNLPNISLRYLMPVYADHGFVPIIKASFIHASFLSESILITMLIPFITKPKKTLKVALLAVGLPSIVVLLATSLVIMTFGPHLSGKFINPYFNMVRYISALEFIQNMDVWVIFVWLFGVFVKLSLYLFVISHGTAQWLRIKNAKKLLWIIAAIVLLLAILPINIAVLLTDYDEKIWAPLIFWPIMVFLPGLTLVLSFYNNKKAKAPAS